ncbi:sushi domain-containing protein 1 isoform X3 [Pleuronectes platessa]|uniref:sushi domain-containing protein 1 isoform X3 n=1 Tax=Pleuronectes platessa TaxID=8262 RepID=UPI00232A1D86|nr:sushi domain-containing protein 1 isoform X3 [Pleuronectes platessa]
MIVVFLLCVVAGMPASGQIRDVCPTCHRDAKCDDKPDGSGKVCNCKYGFVGNGITFCQDKDECQIGAMKICGQHTKCHNTYGSYDCTCLSGYNPSNNMTIFIPNDGTHCQDIDECRITGLCGDGGRCRNLDGSFECSCQVGYQVEDGTEPFHPQRDKASCKVVDCGQPASVEDTVLLSATGTTYGSVATWVCDEGFIWGSGHNTSVCGADGLWSGPTMVCEEVDCGSPAARPHSQMLWNKSSRVGSEVVYQCNSGYHNVGKGNVSSCTTAGQWEEPPVLCQETLCGSPPLSESTEHIWNGSTAPGSTVQYFCKTGFLTRGGHNISVCKENGQWTPPTLVCQEISCGDPPTVPHTGQVRNGSSTPGSHVTYYCKIGFNHSEGNNVSLCTINGSWTKPNISCKAKCGPVPFLANSEVVWHNRSVVIHRCVDGYHSWRGRSVSVCGSSGTWQTATLRCIEIKPAISHVHFLNEKCVHWKAEKYEEDSEDYRVTYTGTRDYQRSFRDEMKQYLSSKAEELKLCLLLLPATNYSISITALSSRFTASITTNTSVPEPPVPVVYYREFETPVPTLRLTRSANSLDPISLYQVLVLPVEGIMVFDCSSPGSTDPLSKNNFSSEYITAQILIGQVGTQMDFTVGDGLYYGGFYNAPLKKGRTYYIILRAVSQWKTTLKSSCVLWAKVIGTSYVLMVSSLSAAAAVGLVAFAILIGYSCMWLFKKT